MDEITLFNTHCCGEIGDVVTGIKGLNFKSPEEASKKLFLDKKWRNFFLMNLEEGSLNIVILF